MANTKATKTAKLISDLVFGDNRIMIEPSQLVETLSKDGDVPTEDEAFVLVYGNDDGEVPKELKTKFKNTSKLIASFF